MSLISIVAVLSTGAFTIFGAMLIWQSWFPQISTKERRILQYSALCCALASGSQLVLLALFAESRPWLLLLPLSFAAPVWFNERERAPDLTDEPA